MATCFVGDVQKRRQSPCCSGRAFSEIVFCPLVQGSDIDNAAYGLPSDVTRLIRCSISSVTSDHQARCAPADKQLSLAEAEKLYKVCFNGFSGLRAQLKLLVALIMKPARSVDVNLARAKK